MDTQRRSADANEGVKVLYQLNVSFNSFPQAIGRRERETAFFEELLKIFTV